MINEMALNEAGWTFLETWRTHSDQELNGRTFNNTKTIVRATIAKYLEVAMGIHMVEGDQEKLWCLLQNISHSMITGQNRIMDAIRKVEENTALPSTEQLTTIVEGLEGIIRGRKGDAGISFAELQQKAHEMACAKGWWDDPRGIPECLALIHSEVSEALEDYRNGNMGLAFHVNGQEQFTPFPKDMMEMAEAGQKPEGFTTELADIVIRVMDLAGNMGIDLEGAIRVKMAYNATRPHRHGGKAA